MADYIEGKRPVLEALRTHVAFDELLLADNLQRDGLVEDLLRKAKKHGVAVRTVSRKELDKRSERGSHQGVMARTKPYEYANVTAILEEVARKAATQAAQATQAPQAAREAAREASQKDAALVIVLDHITDSGNLGAIARSAEVVGASGMIIPNKRSAHVTNATYKSSAGAISHLKLSQVANLVQTLKRLKEEGFWVVGASEQANDVVWDANLKGKIVLVLGNEGEGLARLTQEHCDFLVKLPQAGEVGSLNVAQAGTALMYEWLRQNRPS